MIHELFAQINLFEKTEMLIYYCFEKKFEKIVHYSTEA